MKTILSQNYASPSLPAQRRTKAGFTLIQLSIIITVASLIFVATLPGVQTSLRARAASVTKMNNILNTMRGYMAANGVLPCPADPTQAIGANNYGVAAANPGTTNNCTGGTPAAAYADSTNHIAIGMVPVKTLGLSYADALDGYSRDITYAVDTNATGNGGGAPCWASNSLAGAITVNDYGSSASTIAVLVSHGADGYGAWLPLSGTSGTASRFDNGSTDTSQAANAQVATGGGVTPLTSGNFVSFVRQTATSTFDDTLVYKSNLYTLNNLPTSAQPSNWPAVTPPSNGTYTTGQVLTFTIAYANTVTVTGTPQLDLSALGGGTIGTGNKAYATYQSGSGTNTLTFSYTVQNADSAPTSGLTMNAWIDLNGGTISGGSTCFTAPSLTGVLIGNPGYYRAVTIDHTKVGTVSNTDQANFPMLFTGTYSYLKTVTNGGQVQNSLGYDIYFSSDSAGHTLLPFEQESWNSSTGASVFWVQIPTVSHTTDTVIYLQYGNPNITTDQSNKTGTWNSNYVGVWHLDETSGTTNADSTSNAANEIKVSSSSPAALAGGIINGADQFNGTSDFTHTASSATDLTGDITLEAWVNPQAWGNQPSTTYSQRYLADAKDVNNGYQLTDYGSATGGRGFVWAVNIAGTQYIASTANNGQQGGVNWALNTWYHVVGTYKSSSHAIVLYVNGTVPTAGTASGWGLGNNPDHLRFGVRDDNNGWANAYLDEVRLSNSVLSADWINTEYSNQTAPDKATYGSNGFYTVGSQMNR